MLVAAARPQWGEREEAVFQRGRDLAIVLDVSLSMLAEDVHPNRLQRAKADILDLVRELRGDRASLIAFRHKASLLCPLTTDRAFLVQAIDTVDVNSAPAGQTDIGDAIRKAIQCFESDKGSHKAIILISDGEDIVGDALKAAEEAREENIPIFAVGLGSSRGSKIPRPDVKNRYVEHNGKEVTTKLDRSALRAIAEKSNGVFIPVGTGSMATTTLGTLYRDHLRKITVRDFEETRERRCSERYQWFLVPAFLSVLICALLSQGRLQRKAIRSVAEPGAGPSSRSQIPSPTKNLTPSPQPLKDIAIILIALTLGAAHARAQTESDDAVTNDGMAAVSPDASDSEDTGTPPGRSGARLGQKLHRSGKYKEAAAAYLNATAAATKKEQRDFRYNAGVALYEAGEYKQASDILAEVVASAEERRADSEQALGASFFKAAEIDEDPTADELTERERLLRESAEAFKGAAKQDSENEAARKNLGVVLNALEDTAKQARIARLAEKYEKHSAADVAREMLVSQRDLLTEIPAAFSNPAPHRISQLEDLAETQKENAELWIPLTGKLMELFAGITGSPDSERAMEEVLRECQAAKHHMLDTRKSLRDLDQRGADSAVKSERGVYRIWKGVAPYNQLLLEDLLRQTNTIDFTRGQTNIDTAGHSEQVEALDLTKLFLKRFKDAMQQQESQPQPGGSAEQEQGGITKEDREKVIALAGQAIELQGQAVNLLKQKGATDALLAEEKSYELLKEIEKILSKQKGDQKKQKDEQDKQKKDSDEKPEPQDPKEKKEVEVPPDSIMKILRKALEREREHEAKKRRIRRFELSPIGPDV